MHLHYPFEPTEKIYYYIEFINFFLWIFLLEVITYYTSYLKNVCFTSLSTLVVPRFEEACVLKCD